MKHCIFCLAIFSLMILSWCSIPWSSNMWTIQTWSTISKPTYQEPETITETINNTQITRSKSFVEDTLTHSSQLTWYQSGTVDVYMIEPSWIWPEAIWFKNLTSINQLTSQLVAAQCKIQNDGDIAFSVPDVWYQNQIDMLNKKVAQNGVASLTPLEHSVYEKSANPCPYFEGSFKIGRAGLVWYRNPKIWWWVNSYISNISTETWSNSAM